MLPQRSTSSTSLLSALPTIDGLNGVYASKCALFGLPRDPEISRRLLFFDRNRAREFDFSDINLSSSSSSPAIAGGASFVTSSSKGNNGGGGKKAAAAATPPSSSSIIKGGSAPLPPPPPSTAGTSFRALLDALIAAPEIEALVWRRGGLTDEHVEHLVNAARRFIGLDEIDLGENPRITNVGANLLLQLVASRSIGTVPRVVRLDQTSVTFDMQAKLSAALAARSGHLPGTERRKSGDGGGGNNKTMQSRSGTGAAAAAATGVGPSVMSPQVKAFLDESALAAVNHRDDDTALLGGDATADRRFNSAAQENAMNRRVGLPSPPMSPFDEIASGGASTAITPVLQRQQQSSFPTEFAASSEDSRRFSATILSLVSLGTHAIARVLAVALWVRPLRTSVYAVCCGCAIAFLLGPSSAFLDIAVLIVAYLYLMRSRNRGDSAATTSSSSSSSTVKVLSPTETANGVSAFIHFVGISHERRRRWTFLLDPLEQLSREVALAEQASYNNSSGSAGIVNNNNNTPATITGGQHHQQLLIRDIGLRFISFAANVFEDLKLPISIVSAVAIAVGSVVRLVLGTSSVTLGSMALVMCVAFFSAEPLSRSAVTGRMKNLRRTAGRWIAGVPLTSADSANAMVLLAASDSSNNNRSPNSTALVAAGGQDDEFAQRRPPFAFVVEVLRIEDAVIRTNRPDLRPHLKGSFFHGGSRSHHLHSRSSSSSHHHQIHVSPIEPVVKLKCMNKTYSTCGDATVHTTFTSAGSIAVTTSAHWHPQASVAFPSPHPFDTAKLVFQVYDGSASDIGVAASASSTNAGIIGGGTDILMSGTYLVDDDIVFGREIAVALRPAASSASVGSGHYDGGGGSVVAAADSVWSLSDALLRQIDQRDAKERHRHHVYQNESRTARALPSAVSYGTSGQQQQHHHSQRGLVSTAHLLHSAAGPTHTVDRAGVLIVRFTEVERSAAAAVVAIEQQQQQRQSSPRRQTGTHATTTADMTTSAGFATTSATPIPVALSRRPVDQNNNTNNSNNNRNRLPSSVAAAGTPASHKSSSTASVYSQQSGGNLVHPAAAAVSTHTRATTSRNDVRAPSSSRALPSTQAGREIIGGKANAKPSATPRAMSQESLCSCSSNGTEAGTAGGGGGGAGTNAAVRPRRASNR